MSPFNHIERLSKQSDLIKAKCECIQETLGQFMFQYIYFNNFMKTDFSIAKEFLQRITSAESELHSLYCSSHTEVYYWYVGFYCPSLYVYTLLCDSPHTQERPAAL